MSEMVERLKVAIGAALEGGDPDGVIRVEGNIVQLDGRFDLEAVVRAAIKAMRKPTKAMLDAGEGCDDHTTGFAQGADCETHWHAMIKAALKG